MPSSVMASSGSAADAAVAFAPDKPWNAAYVTQRSKAMPKNSLFGSVLERLSDDELTRAQAIDAAAYERQELDRRTTLKQAYDKTAPPHLTGHVREKMAELEKHRASMLQSEARLREQEKAIHRVDEMARYFRLPPVEPQQQQLPQPQSTLTMAVPQLNLDLAREMNRLGVSGSNSYNRDKYQRRAPVHSYAHLGPPLERGMEFTHSATETAEQYADPAAAAAAAAAESASGGKRRSGQDDGDDSAAGGQRPLYPQGEALVAAIERPHAHAHAHAPAAAGPRSLGAELVPANIRRSFGSKQFDLLFSDEAKTRALVDGLRGSREARRQSRRHVSAPTGADTPPATNYNDLSYVMRTDTFAGHTFYRPSLAKESYTKDVFDRRYVDPEQFRHTRDAYGRWKEHELQRTRLLSEYDALVASLPKHERAAAVAVVERKPPPAPEARKDPKRTRSKAAKAKGKPKPADKENDAPKIVFQTPPMSATAGAATQQSTKVFVQEDFKKDDAFWDFYDSGA